MTSTTRLIVLFNLKPGRSHLDYEDWARGTDLPTVNALASVDRFELYRATGLLGTGAPSPFQYIEVIDVSDMARFGEEVTTETMRKIAAEFQAWADPVFIATERIGG